MQDKHQYGSNHFSAQPGVADPNRYQPIPPLYGGPPQPKRSAEDESVEAKHRDSVKKFPELSISRGEYVIEAIRRHPIGIISIWALVIFLVLILLFALSFYSINRAEIAKMFLISGDLPSAATLFPGVLILAGFFVLGGIIATIVYNGNRFYLTNESVFQFVQHSLFSTRLQVVNLINVEDASHDQKGILQQVLNYGTLRLSTQGEETTYHFYFVANPKRIVSLVNDAAEKAVMKLEGVPINER